MSGEGSLSGRRWQLLLLLSLLDRRADPEASSPVTVTITGSPPSRPHLILITSQRPQLLTPAPWGVKLRHGTLEDRKTCASTSCVCVCVCACAHACAVLLSKEHPHVLSDWALQAGRGQGGDYYHFFRSEQRPTEVEAATQGLPGRGCMRAKTPDSFSQLLIPRSFHSTFPRAGIGEIGEAPLPKGGNRKWEADRGREAGEGDHICSYRLRQGPLASLLSGGFVA